MNSHVKFTDDINHVFERETCNIPQVHQSVSVKVHPVAPQSPPFQPPGHVNCKYTTQIRYLSLNYIILNCLPIWYRVLWSIWISYELQYHMAKLVVVMNRNKSQQATEGASKMSVLQSLQHLSKHTSQNLYMTVRTNDCS